MDPVHLLQITWTLCIYYEYSCSSYVHVLLVRVVVGSSIDRQTDRSIVLIAHSHRTFLDFLVPLEIIASATDVHKVPSSSVKSDEGE